MRHLIAASALALLVASGSPLAAVAQTADPVTGEAGTLITADELENAALNDIDEVRVVDVEPHLEGSRGDLLRQAMDDSDTDSIRAFLEQDTEVSRRVRDALGESGVAEDEVAALILHEDNRLVVLYRRGS